jgi:hypothetical protein
MQAPRLETGAWNMTAARTLPLLVSLCAFAAHGQTGTATETPPQDAPPPVSAVSAAVLETAASLRDMALAGTDAYSIVRSLTVEVGPRPAGSEGDRAAVAWALSQLHELEFDAVRAEEVTVPHWERGSADVSIVEPYAQSLTAVALGGSVGTDDVGIEAPVLAVADLEELIALPDRVVRGTIVYFSKRMARSRDGSGYVEAVRPRKSGPVEAARRGAVAMLMRSAGTSISRFGHTGTTTYEQGVAPIPALALAHADADMLEHQLAGGRPVIVHLRLTSRSLPEARSANVIAEVPGRGDGIVLLGAHLDSWDLGTGALDDAAGVGIVLAAARLIADLPEAPLRTIRVVLFANEEFGLSGAKAYAAQHAEELAEHVVGLEADFGADRVWKLDSQVAEAALPIVDAIHEAIATLGIERGPNDATGGPDLGPLREMGMPILNLWQDGTFYFDYHHTADDTLDKIDPEKLDQAVAAFVATTYIAASGESDFGRLEPVAPSAP